MRFVFGPVPSRRLGRSLGIDPIPFKTCNWNCVYCQLGRTSPLVNQRRDYFPPEEIVADVARRLEASSPGEIDWLTFVGSGEPTLHASLGWMIERLQSLTPLPIAVITNGSLLHLPEVRGELRAANAVLPSLDAGSETLYRKINRALPELTFDSLVDGLAAFRREYPGKLWVEVMLIKGLNDTPEALADLAEALKNIQPDEVHLNLPIRPPCEPWVEPADAEGLARAVKILGAAAHVVQPREGEFGVSAEEDVVDALIDIMTRHPMREEELLRTLQQFPPERIHDALDELRRSGKAQVVERQGERFWSCSAARYVSEPLSRCHRAGGTRAADHGE